MLSGSSSAGGQVCHLHHQRGRSRHPQHAGRKRQPDQVHVLGLRDRRHRRRQRDPHRQRGPDQRGPAQAGIHGALAPRGRHQRVAAASAVTGLLLPARPLPADGCRRRTFGGSGGGSAVLAAGAVGVAASAAL